jgi:hypothetical protein
VENKLFKLNKEIFDIEQAYIDIIFDDLEEGRLIVGLTIEGKRIDDNILPYIESETLLKIKKHEIKRWQDIVGRTIEWKNFSKNKNRPYAEFINFGKKQTSAYLYNAKIEFIDKNANIFIKIKALCDIKSKTIPLEIETEINCMGLYLGKRKENEEELKKIIEPYLDPNFLECTKTEDGNIKFIPK